MNTDSLNSVLLGAIAMSSCIAGLFFLRFWKTSRDRFFVFFAIAFWLLALNWLALAVTHWVHETQHRIFFVRLAAFALIIVGIVDKNGRASSEPPRR